MEQIYLHIFSIFAEKENKSKPENEDKKENRNQSIKTKMKLCHIVTDHIHNYHSARPDTQFKVG